MRRGIAVWGLAAALGIAGCGGASKPPHEESAEAIEAKLERAEHAAQLAKLDAETKTIEAEAAAHPYPPNIQAIFLRYCTAEGGGGSCECALKHVEAAVPIGQFYEDEEELLEGKAPPFSPFVRAIGHCLGREAAEAESG
jgi:hypothetical protein